MLIIQNEFEEREKKNLAFARGKAHQRYRAWRKPAGEVGEPRACQYHRGHTPARQSGEWNSNL